jgi:transposase
MVEKRYIVKLTSEEREQLLALVSKGKGAAYRLTHARILLKADANVEDGHWTNAAIMAALDVGNTTIYRVRKAFVEGGLEQALARKKRETPPTPRIIDGRTEARLIQLACSTPPEGRNRWTMQLLADQMVALNIVEAISDSTVCRVLKKTS